MSPASSKYNYCIDFLKGIACVCVVLMHCEFPGRLGILVQAVSRFCVPFFFMVSGYFSRPAEVAADTGGLRSWLLNRKVIHIAKITFWASLFYLVWAAVRYFLWQEFSNGFSWAGLAAWVGFNRPLVISGHLWFLFALLYDYVLISIMDRTKVRQYQFVLGGVSMVLLFLLGQGIHLLGIHVPNFVYRNWLIEGAAFFLLGRWIRANQDWITLSNSALLAIVAVSTLLCIAERWFVGRDFGVNICTLPQVTAMFLYAVRNPSRHAGFIQRLGRDCSMMVYILHIFVWQVLAKVYKAASLSENEPALYALPVLVVIFTFLLAWAYHRLVVKESKI